MTSAGVARRLDGESRKLKVYEPQTNVCGIQLPMTKLGTSGILYVFSQLLGVFHLHFNISRIFIIIFLCPERLPFEPTVHELIQFSMYLSSCCGAPDACNQPTSPYKEAKSQYLHTCIWYTWLTNRTINFACEQALRDWRSHMYYYTVWYINEMIHLCIQQAHCPLRNWIYTDIGCVKTVLNNDNLVAIHHLWHQLASYLLGSRPKFVAILCRLQLAIHQAKYKLLSVL